MPKYHINLKTGLTSKCNAIKGRCPFGDSTNHFESEAIANEIAQKILETKHGLSKTLNVKGLSEREKLDLVIKDIDARGGKVFYVGGYVRDKILGKENKDIDVEIHNIEMDKVKDLLSTYGRVDEVGARFGILKVSGMDIDFAFPRTERNVGDKHVDFDVDVDPYLSPETAARRRDFTMNAIMEDATTGEIIDPFNGVSDLKKGVINLIDKNTFIEDNLRPLRAAQFAARFNMRVSEEVIDLARTLDYTTLSTERVGIEFKKGLLSPHPAVAMNLMLKMGVLDQLSPNLAAMKNTEQNPEHHPEGDVFTHSMLAVEMAGELKEHSKNPLAFMYAALCHDVGKVNSTQVQADGKITSYGHAEVGEKMIAETLKNITKETNFFPYIEKLAKYHMKAHDVTKMKDNKVRRLMTEVDMEELLLLSVCDSNRGTGLLNAVKREHYIEACQRVRKLEQGKPFGILPLITGKDLIAMGAKPGKEMGDTLKLLFNEQLAGSSKEKLTKRAEKIIDKVS